LLEKGKNEKIIFLLLVVLLVCFNYAHSQDNNLKKVIEEDIKTCKEECKTYNSPGFCKRICEKEIFDPRWKFLGFDSFGSAHFYDSESIVVSGNIVKVWGKETFSERGKQNFIKRRIQEKLNVKGYENLDHLLVLIKIDCSERRFQMLEGIYYVLDGSILDHVDIPEFLAKWFSISPNSVMEDLFKEVCETEEK
jgi:hypothetical protein